MFPPSLPSQPLLLPCNRADAKDLRRDPKLRLVPLVSDFKLVAKAFAATNAGKPAAGQAFFARMEFARAQHLFGRYAGGAIEGHGMRIAGSLM